MRRIVTALFPIISIAAAQQAEVTRYDVADGLPQSMVNHVLQDRDGFIWLGTGDGLARFDGQRFVVYKHDPRDSTTLSHNSIWGLAEKDERHLWVGTRSGLDVLDRRTGRSSRHATGLTPDEDGCWMMLGDMGREQVFYSPLSGHLLWIGPPGQRLRRLRHQACYAMHLDGASGTITQFLLPDTLLTIKADGREQVVKLPNQKQGRTMDLVPLGDGWLMLSDQSAWLWSPTKGREPLPATTQAWMDHPSVKKLGAIADGGRVWVGHSGHGVALLDTALRIVQTYPLLPTTDRPLNITMVTPDRQGNIWVGTDGKGVFKIAPQRIKFGRAMPGQGLPWEPFSWFVRGFAPWDEHRVLVNFYQGGFALFDERTNTLEPLDLPAGTRRVMAHHDLIGPWTDRHGTIWLRDPWRVFALEPGSGRSLLEPDKLPGNALARGSDGDMVLLDRHGLRAMRHTAKGIEAEALSSVRLVQWMDSMGTVPDHMAMDARGRIFLCHATAPVTVWSQDVRLPAGPFHRDVRFTMVATAADGDVWMTGNDGLYLLDGASLAVKRHYTVHDGLPDQYLYAMLPAGDGTWWISTNRGLCHFDPRQQRFATHGPQDGLQSMEFNSMAWHRSASGRHYFGGINGFNHFMPGNIRLDRDTAHVVITGMAAQDETIDITTLADGEPLVLPHDRNHLRIDLAVLEFTAPERNLYRYRIEGYADWSTHPAGRPIQLTNMPAGDYVLEVAGINGDGLVSAPRALLRINVPLPFTASPVFFALLGMLTIAGLGGGIFLGYRQRIERRMERSAQEVKELRIRARIAQDLHDDLGSGLARITALARQAEKRADAGEVPSEPVGRLKALSQELMDGLRDVVWVNDPRGGELATLLIRIRDHAQDLFEGTETRCVVDFPMPPPERPIGPVAKRALYLIAKEAAHNASKYSGATEVALRFRIAGGRFELVVEDDGRGKADVVQGGGHGLRNMRERAAELGCTCEAGPRPEGGFRLLLAGPVAALDL